MRISLSIRGGGPSEFPDGWAERLLDPSGREYAMVGESDSGCWVRFHEVGSFVVQPGFSDVVGYPEAATDLAWFRELFFHYVTPWALQRQDWECLHASAVRVGEKVLSFCGPSGRGKSTLARAMVERGAVAYADDAMPFLVRDGSAVAARIPQRARLRGPAASHFADLPRAEAEREIFHDFQETLRPLHVIHWLEPMRDPADLPDPVVEQIPPAEAFRLLLGEAHCLSLQNAACNRKMIRNYLDLARLVPVFRLTFPAGLDHLPAVLDRLANARP